MKYTKFNIEAMCLGEFMGDTYKERFEALYMKVAEISNLILGKSHCLDEVYPTFNIMASDNIVYYFKNCCSSLQPPFTALYDARKRRLVGEMKAANGRWVIWHDTDLWDGELVIEFADPENASHVSTAKLTIDGLPLHEKIESFKKMIEEVPPQE